MITDEELSGFLAMHQGFRAEFGRLAVACRAPRDAAHEALPWVALGWALYGLFLVFVTLAGRAKVTTRTFPAAVPIRTARPR